MKIKWIFLVFIGVLLTAGAVTSCKSRSVENVRVPATTAEEHWTCPMHHQIHMKGPGKCPICGMTLIKIVQTEAGEEHSSATPAMSNVPEDHSAITLSLDQQQMIGVKTGIAEKKPVFKSIRVSGRLAFDPELYTAQSEYVESLKQLQRVKDSPIADVRHSAERMVQSAKLRLKILGLSDQQIANIGKADLSETSLLIHKPGESVWIYAEAYEMDLPLIRPGLSATISANFLAGTTLEGKVVSVDRVINPTTRTAKVRISVSSAKAQLRPESYVDVTILAPLGEQVTVPFDAILDTGTQSWVFVMREGGRIEPTLVTVKSQADGEVAIASGLQGGEKIVTSANFLIDSESRLKFAFSKPAEAPSCPKGQHWDKPMAMCMPDTGG